MIAARGIDAGYGRVPVLHDVTVHAGRGERVAILGSNGSGKSTLLRVLAGLLKPWKGEVQFGEEVITGEAAAARVRRGLSLIPGDRRLFRGLTVRQNVELGAWWVNQEERRQRYEAVVELFPELADFASRIAGDISGGQQQMCALSRALMASPQVLMVDELSMGLAPAVVTRLASALTRVSETGVTVIWVDQKVAEALESTNRAYVLVQGSIAIEADSASLLSDPAFVERYVGL